MKNKKQQKKLSDRCRQAKKYKEPIPLIGLAYGVMPHTGCIMFIIGSVLGATILLQFFRPFLINRYIFHYLMLLSVGFATLSSFLYLKKNRLSSSEGIKKKRKYLSIMYGSTIGINLILFFLVFPLLANFSLTGSVVPDGNSDIYLEVINLRSDIPCPGHAPFISNEMKTMEGVIYVKYSFPNNFEVKYDKNKISINEILGLEIFKEYPALLIDSEIPLTR